jgi:DNA-directed RNA polymerase subunit RPC12/RpoP
MASQNERTPQSPPGAGVLVECLSCGRRSAIMREDGLEDMPLVQLTRRLRCSECGSRAVKAARIETPRDLARLMRARMGSGGS